MRELREQAGLKQIELAEILGQTQSFVSKWESAQRRIDVFQLAEFCDAAGVTLPQFVRQLERRLPNR